MRGLRRLAKQIPLVRSLVMHLHDRYVRYRLRQQAHALKRQTPEQVFTDIYTRNAWGGRHSVSGPGSDVHNTGTIARELAVVCRDLGVSSMLDIPCGDFHWMQNVSLRDIDYVGADIVQELITRNSERYGRDGVRFQHLDLTRDPLPTVDLVLCRDCLVHLSFRDIRAALENLCASQSGYLLTTTFTDRTTNHDVVTGQWRTLNLERAPFSLPRPVRIINEGCTEGDGTYADKALGLWRIRDIEESLTWRGA